MSDDELIASIEKDKKSFGEKLNKSMTISINESQKKAILKTDKIRELLNQLEFFSASLGDKGLGLTDLIQKAKSQITTISLTIKSYE